MSSSMTSWSTLSNMENKLEWSHLSTELLSIKFSFIDFQLGLLVTRIKISQDCLQWDKWNKADLRQLTQTLSYAEM